ncbi:MAG: LptF/LptG family permease [Nitrospinota bacterium]|nr:LptF/LptG family permease [Nitrospinota bacterium]
MKKLHTYLLKEIIVWSFFLLILLTFVLFLGRIFEITQLIIINKIPFTIVLNFLMTSLPILLLTNIPMSVLIATGLVYSKFSHDNELLAMSSSGMSFYSQLTPVILLGTITTLIMFFLTIYALPWGFLNSRAISKRIISISQIDSNIQEQVFKKIADGIVIFVGKKSKESKVLRGIIISESRNKKNKKIIFAKKAIFKRNKLKNLIIFQLYDGSIHTEVNEIQKRGNIGNSIVPTQKRSYRITQFKKYHLKIDLLQRNEDFSPFRLRLRELPIEVLNFEIENAEKDSKKELLYLIEFHRRIAFPLIPLIFAMLGASLGVTNQRTGRQGGFLFSLIILFFYYLLDTFFKGIGENGFLYPIVSAWGANVVLLTLTLYTVRKVNNEGSIQFLNLMVKPFESLSNLINIITRKS